MSAYRWRFTRCSALGRDAFEPRPDIRELSLRIYRLHYGLHEQGVDVLKGIPAKFSLQRRSGFALLPASGERPRHHGFPVIPKRRSQADDAESRGFLKFWLDQQIAGTNYRLVHLVDDG